MTTERTDLSEQEVQRHWNEHMGPVTGEDAYYSWHLLPAGDKFRALNFARAILTAARQSVTAAQREAASKAWDACSAMVMGYTNLDARDRYLDAHHPLPPRECVEDAKPPVLTWHEVGWYKRDLADETGRVVAHVDDCHGYLVGTGSIGRYITREQAADAVMKAALKSFAAGVGR